MPYGSRVERTAKESRNRQDRAFPANALRKSSVKELLALFKFILIKL